MRQTNAQTHLIYCHHNIHHRRLLPLLRVIVSCTASSLIAWRLVVFIQQGSTAAISSLLLKNSVNQTMKLPIRRALLCIMIIIFCLCQRSKHCLVVCLGILTLLSPLFWVRYGSVDGWTSWTVKESDGLRMLFLKVQSNCWLVFISILPISLWSSHIRYISGSTNTVRVYQRNVISIIY